MENAVLILIDWQVGFDDHSYWGGNRNNPQAEDNALQLLSRWRSESLPIIHCVHDSRDLNSILRITLPSGKLKSGFEPKSEEPLIIKNVNSCFIGTDLETRLRQFDTNKLVICGLTTNHCVSTTTRMAGNLGFDVTLIGDACATFDRQDMNGKLIDAETVHQVSLANIHNEFCIVKTTAEVLGLN